jgi:hypothetical protein
VSRLSVTRGDLARLWSVTAKLQDAAGKPVDAQYSRDAASRTRDTTSWLNGQSGRMQALSDSRRAARNQTLVRGA